MAINKVKWQIQILLLEEIAKEKLGVGYQTKLAALTGLKQSNLSRMFSLKYSPTLETFTIVSAALKINHFFEDQESKTDLNILFEKAMESLGRRAGKLSRN